MDYIDRIEYPAGVPCWIDTEQPDPEAAAEFYGGIFGWAFENKLPPGIPDRYLVASLHGFEVAAIASPTAGLEGPPEWNTYVSVADADRTAATAAATSGEVTLEPVDAGPPGSVAGRWAALRDPEGVAIRLWQPGYRQGSQLVNAPGTWNASNLTTLDAGRAIGWYGALFGWEASPVDFAGDGVEGTGYMWRRPGYGDFLAIRDPDIRRRHDSPFVPEGFSDAIGWMTEVTGPATPGWRVTFAVDDVDAVADRAIARGGVVVSGPTDVAGGMLRTATLRDPGGAELTVARFDPTRRSGAG